MLKAQRQAFADFHRSAKRSRGNNEIAVGRSPNRDVYIIVRNRATSNVPDTALYITLRKYHLCQVQRNLAPGSIRSVFRGLAFRKGTVTAMSEEDRRFLCEYYRDDVLRLARLLDRDLRSWLV